VDPEERRFIEGLKAGDQLAFKTLVDTFATKVYHSALGILQNEEDAQDISQEVFIAIHSSIKNFKGDSTLSTWIYRITMTRSLDLLRKNKRQKRSGIMKRLFGDDGSAGSPEIVVPSFDHPGIRLENKEKASILFKAIAQLPENQKAAFSLHNLDELSYQEVAEVMETSVSAVESLIHRAKQNLRKYLNTFYKDRTQAKKN
jgi:RNA polymerase sigma factor (sigma-70 family)